MYLKKLAVHSFRNYAQHAAQFEKGVNWIVGPNGQGKTNLLEAAWLLMTGRSFRTSQVADLISHGAEGFYVEAVYTSGLTSHRLALRYTPNGYLLERNGQKLPSLVSLFGGLVGTLWTSDDVQLIKGGPMLRRRYLSTQMAQADPGYTELAIQYQRALKQRNCLLKQQQTGQLEVWDATLARLAAEMTRRHLAWVEALNKLLLYWFPQLFPGHQLQIQYSAGLDECHEATFLQRWKMLRPRELATGHTLAGPHRDDLMLLLNGVEMKRCASEGQQRGCAAALRLAEWQRLRDATRHIPLLLVDDFSLGFDPERQERLCALLEGLNAQLIITAPEKRVRQPGIAAVAAP
jgi:DNA replication and repair protein RecF